MAQKQKQWIDVDGEIVRNPRFGLFVNGFGDWDGTWDQSIHGTVAPEVHQRIAENGPEARYGDTGLGPSVGGPGRYVKDGVEWNRMSGDIRADPWYAPQIKSSGDVVFDPEYGWSMKQSAWDKLKHQKDNSWMFPLMAGAMLVGGPMATSMGAYGGAGAAAASADGGGVLGASPTFGTDATLDQMIAGLSQGGGLTTGGGVSGLTGAAPGFAGSFAPTLSAGAAGESLLPQALNHPVTEAARTASTANAVKNGIEKITTGSKIADSLIATAITGAIAGSGKQDDPAGDLADEQRDLEAERQRRIAEGTAQINSMFAGFDDPYYEGVSKAYRDHYDKLIAEQAEAARRKVQLGWQGGPGTSGYVRRMGELERDIERQYADVASQSVDFANQRRSDLESNRSAILGALEGGSSIDTVANQASATAARLSAPPSYSPVGDLFARLTSIPANQTLARNQGYDTKPLRFNSGKGAVTVVG